MEHVAQREARIEGGEHKDTDQDHTFIKELLSLHDRFMSTVSQQFEGHSLLQRALKDAFVTVVNKVSGMCTICIHYCVVVYDLGIYIVSSVIKAITPKFRVKIRVGRLLTALFLSHLLLPYSTALLFSFSQNVGQHTNATLMSSYCNKLLRTGGAKLSEEEIEEQLVKVIQVFSYLTDKDLFAEFYRNQLAKRLLNQRSASNDAELSMIMKLKVKCGSQFTSKMQVCLFSLLNPNPNCIYTSICVNTPFNPDRLALPIVAFAYPYHYPPQTKSSSSLVCWISNSSSTTLNVMVHSQPPAFFCAYYFVLMLGHDDGLGYWS